jgi:hypothetical protein
LAVSTQNAAFYAKKTTPQNLGAFYQNGKKYAK